MMMTDPVPKYMIELLRERYPHVDKELLECGYIANDYANDFTGTIIICLDEWEDPITMWGMWARPDYNEEPSLELCVMQAQGESAEFLLN